MVIMIVLVVVIIVLVVIMGIKVLTNIEYSQICCLYRHFVNINVDAFDVIFMLRYLHQVGIMLHISSVSNIVIVLAVMGMIVDPCSKRLDHYCDR